MLAWSDPAAAQLPQLSCRRLLGSFYIEKIGVRS